MDKVENFIVPPSLDWEQVLKHIRHEFETVGESPYRIQEKYYDTFDWRLYKKGMVLFSDGDTYHLAYLDKSGIAADSAVNNSDHDPFWWDFSNPRFQDKLKSLLDMRALIPMCRIDKRISPIRVLNNDEKTVLRIHYEEVAVSREDRRADTQRLIKLKPVRGYKKEARRGRNLLKSLHIQRKINSELEWALRNVGQQPADYSSRIKIKLRPDCSIQEAAAAIFQRLLQIMELNEDGIRKDIDTEFLHDFRTAVRRTRSGLSRIKGAFPPEIINEYKENFSYIQKKTNTVRDLDVYLLNQDEYSRMLPEELQPGLNTFFKFLSQRREDEFKRLLAFLESGEYKKIKSDWANYLQSVLDQSAQIAAGEPVMHRARKAIRKQFKRVGRFWNQTHAETTDAEIHNLRIELKKLRYTLEFFSSMFPEGQVKQILKQFKTLQTRLGDFNDLRVQQDQMRSFLEHYQVHNREDVIVAAAIGGLIAKLNEKQQQVRAEIGPQFQAVGGHADQKLLRQLFADAGRAEKRK